MFSRFVVTALVLLLPLVASADRIARGSGQMGKITRIGGGIMEFGLDNMLIVRTNSDTTPANGATPESTTKTLEAIFVGGPTFRYFLMDNFSLALNVNAFIGADNTETTTSGTTTENKVLEVGVLGTLMLDYYVSLGHGMFLKPGIGGGGLYTRSETPVAGTNFKATNTRVGGVGRVQLGFVYYASRHWNLKAGVDLIMQFGNREVATRARSPTSTSSPWTSAGTSASATCSKAGFPLPLRSRRE